MYIIRTRDADLNITEMCVGDATNLRSVVDLLEKCKQPYKVGNAGDLLHQRTFGWGGYQYWRTNIENWD